MKKIKNILIWILIIIIDVVFVYILALLLSIWQNNIIDYVLSFTVFEMILIIVSALIVNNILIKQIKKNKQNDRKQRK